MRGLILVLMLNTCYLDIILIFLVVTKNLKNPNFMAPFYGRGSTASRLEPVRGGSLLFTTKVPRNSWYSFYRPLKDERLSRPWSHPLVLNTKPLDWESSALTTRPLLLTTEWLLIFLPYIHPNIHRFSVFYTKKKIVRGLGPTPSPGHHPGPPGPLRPPAAIVLALSKIDAPIFFMYYPLFVVWYFCNSFYRDVPPVFIFVDFVPKFVLCYL